MSLLQQNMQKNVTTNTQLILEAQADESFRVKRIHTARGANAHIKVRVNRQIVADIRQSGVTGSHCYFTTNGLHKMSLYNWLIHEGIFSPIPVPSGMKLFIDGAHDADSIVQVEYDKFDNGDVTENEVNGTKSNRYDLIQYGQIAGAAVSGENLFTTQISDSAYPAFPFGRVVPAKMRFTLRGIAFSSFNKTDNTNADRMISGNLRFVRERKTLFDEDLNGLLYEGLNSATDDQTYGNGQQSGGQRSSVDISDPLIFDTPIVFDEGEDLDIFLNMLLIAGAVNVDAIDTEIGLIFNVEKTA